MDEHNFVEESVKRVRRVSHTTWIIMAVLVFTLVSMVAGTYVYGQSYQDRVYPGVSVGDFDIGGMNEVELAGFIGRVHEKLLEQGIAVTLHIPDSDEPVDFVLYPRSTVDDMSMSLIDIDTSLVARELIAYRKSGNPFVDAVTVFASRIERPRMPLGSIDYDRDGLLHEIEKFVSPHITSPVDADISITSVSPLRYEITTSSAGTSFAYDEVFADIALSWSNLSRPILTIASEYTEPTITEEDVENAVEQLPDILASGTIELTYTDPGTKRVSTWKFTPTTLAEWLSVEKNDEGMPMIVLRIESTKEYLIDTISPIVTVDPRNASFVLGSNGKVTDFVSSRPGVTLDAQATYDRIVSAFESRLAGKDVSPKIELVIQTLEADIRTGDTNDLGISEILGVGHSRFAGSPGDRVKNIRHAAYNKLHGLLIKPGENFSLNNALKPYTLAGGYVPELVIKGDRIVPEIGGGLCQVGSTMFRAAMNSGLDITERRNHSLVVSYYNDLSNGNPGTDATIYDPSPDFRFLNDTGHHVLITTYLNEQTADLYFTFWGTSDGRKGYYTPPKVSQWIPAGGDKIVETTELAPGVRKCQNKYDGAHASFTYIREMPNGEKISRVFTSYYRPLPRLCLVGVAPVVPATPDEIPQPEDTTPAEEELPASDTFVWPTFVE